MENTEKLVMKAVVKKVKFKEEDKESAGKMDRKGYAF